MVIWSKCLLVFSFEMNIDSFSHKVSVEQSQWLFSPVSGVIFVCPYWSCRSKSVQTLHLSDGKQSPIWPMIVNFDSYWNIWCVWSICTSKIFIYTVYCSINEFFLGNFLRYVTKGKSQVHAIGYDVCVTVLQAKHCKYLVSHILFWFKSLRHVREFIRNQFACIKIWNRGSVIMKVITHLNFEVNLQLLINMSKLKMKHKFISHLPDLRIKGTLSLQNSI